MMPQGEPRCSLEIQTWSMNQTLHICQYWAQKRGRRMGGEGGEVGRGRGGGEEGWEKGTFGVISSL